jgi:hypothetical protein
LKYEKTSGWGWDNERQIPSTSDYVWNAYIAAQPDAKEFLSKTLTFFDDYEDIFDGKFALCCY